MHYASGTTFLFGVIFLALIEIRNLCKTFGTGSTAVHALEDVSLDIEAGEIFGIIGLSGAGKSTLVRCMNLLERPIIADMILSCGAPVSIVYADTRSIEGRLYGHTVLQLPSDPAVAEKLRRWLSDEGVIFTEEE